MQMTVTDSRQYIPTNGDVFLAMILRNTGSNTIFYGWEDTTSAAAGANQGVPLEADELLSLAGRDIDVAGRLFVICATGLTSTLNYTIRR